MREMLFIVMIVMSACSTGQITQSEQLACALDPWAVALQKGATLARQDLGVLAEPAQQAANIAVAIDQSMCQSIAVVITPASK
jgi:hypothetical protein